MSDDTLRRVVFGIAAALFFAGAKALSPKEPGPRASRLIRHLFDGVAIVSAIVALT